MASSKKYPDCLFVKAGGRHCLTDLPKPNQLCAACRPFWVKSKIKPTRKG
jgi:hypothetical protein